MEITTAEQNKKKRTKRIEDSLRDLWDNIKCTNIRIIGVPEEEEKKKGTEKIFEQIIVENFSNMGNSQSSPGSAEDLSIQDISKEKHTKTHINQTIKNWTSLMVQWLRIHLPMHGTRV